MNNNQPITIESLKAKARGRRSAEMTQAVTTQADRRHYEEECRANLCQLLLEGPLGFVAGIERYIRLEPYYHNSKPSRIHVHLDIPGHERITITYAVWGFIPGCLRLCNDQSGDWAIETSGGAYRYKVLGDALLAAEELHREKVEQENFDAENYF